MEKVRILIDKYYPEGSHLRDIFLSHATCVGKLALTLNSRLPVPLDEDEVMCAALLHDIGIFLTHAPSIHCHGELPYIAHGYAGADLLRREGVDEKYVRVCERHTGTGLSHQDIEIQNLPLPRDRNYLPETTLEKLICYADKFFSKSGDMKIKSKNEVKASISKHGTAALNRFKVLEKLFDK